jgi:hypothetical protein
VENIWPHNPLLSSAFLSKEKRYSLYQIRKKIMPFKSTDSQTFFSQIKWGKKYEALFLGLFDHHPMIHSA